MNASNGYIKLDRKILKWEWYQDLNVRILFIHCLLSANWKETQYKGVSIPRGSFVASLPILSTGSGLSIQQARTALSKLKSTGEITVKKYPKYTIYTVSNYSLYQDDNRQSNSQSTGNLEAEQQSINRQLNSQSTGSIYTKVNNLLKEEEKKEIKNNKYIYSAAEHAPEPTAVEAESLFEELWKAYPQKRGKGSVSITAKKKLLKIGREHMLRAIDRYVRECETQGRYFKNGSTFFNSGYVDYLDENYTPLREKTIKASQKYDDVAMKFFREHGIEVDE